jgi:hypothetical protein
MQKMSEQRAYRREPRNFGPVLRQWLGAAGFLNAELWERLGTALRSSLPAAWCGHVQVCRVAGGEVTLAVDSAALLAELRSFHAARLRVAMCEAAPRQGLRRLKFILSPAGAC